MPTLEPRDHLEYQLNISVALPGRKTANVSVSVEVWDGIQKQRQIHVSGVLPAGNRLEHGVRRAINDKLPKLVAVSAEERFLILEKPTMADSENSVISLIRKLAPEFPLLKKIQAIVVAKTFLLSEKTVYFDIWDVATEQWTEHLKAIIAE